MMYNKFMKDNINGTYLARRTVCVNHIQAEYNNFNAKTQADNNSIFLYHDHAFLHKQSIL